MDLLKIDDRRWVNLDRLASVTEEPAGDGFRLTLVVGQDTLALDPDQSRAFMAYVAGNYRLRTLAPGVPTWSAGRAVVDAPGPGEAPG